MENRLGMQIIFAVLEGSSLVGSIAFGVVYFSIPNMAWAGIPKADISKFTSNSVFRHDGTHITQSYIAYTQPSSPPIYSQSCSN